MKFKNRTFLLVCMVALCSSCSVERRLERKIIGTWHMVSHDRISCEDPDDNFFEEYVCTSVDCVTLTFNKDGSYVFKSVYPSGFNETHLNYSIMDDELTIHSVPLRTYKLSINGKTMMLETYREVGCDGISELRRN